MKPKIKSRVPWESKQVIEKRECLKKASNLKRTKPTKSNMAKFKKAQKDLVETYESEERLYVLSQIDKLKNAAENRQSSVAWKTVNEITERKTSSNSKLKATSQEELWAVLNISWKKHPTKQRLYGHLPPITNVIKERRTRFAGHCWRSKDEIISDVLLWTPKHGHTQVGRPYKTYIMQICEDIGCQPEDLPRAMEDRADWRERVWKIRAISMT